MTTPDPVTLARVMLDTYEGEPHDVTFVWPWRDVHALARAVLSLTVEVDAELEENTRLRGQIARVEAETFRLDAEGVHGVQDARDPHSTGWHDSQIIAARRIRTALNGDPA